MAQSTPARSGRPFTYLDLDGLQDDGNVHELSYGTLIVSRWATTRHQAIATALVEVAAPAWRWRSSGPTARSKSRSPFPTTIEIRLVIE